MHEVVELVKALAWPCVVIYFLIRFRRQIASMLDEMPSALRRMRSAHGLGVEIELDRLAQELPRAREEAQSLALPMPAEPKHQGTLEGERHE